MSDEIEILRHQVAVLQRNLDRAREDHDKERRIMLDRLRAAHEAIEAMRPLTVAKSHTVDVYDRARDAVDAYSRAPYVPESWYALSESDEPEGSFIGGWDGFGDAAEHERTRKASIAASEARYAQQAARDAAQVGKRRH